MFQKLMEAGLMVPRSGLIVLICLARSKTSSVVISFLIKWLMKTIDFYQHSILAL